jgi:hypothetical protein
MDDDQDRHEQLLYRIDNIEKHVLTMDSRSIDTNERTKRIEHLVRDIEYICFLFVISGIGVFLWLGIKHVFF